MRVVINLQAGYVVTGCGVLNLMEMPDSILYESFAKESMRYLDMVESRGKQFELKNGEVFTLTNDTLVYTLKRGLVRVDNLTKDDHVSKLSLEYLVDGSSVDFAEFLGLMAHRGKRIYHERLALKMAVVKASYIPDSILVPKPFDRMDIQGVSYLVYTDGFVYDFMYKMDLVEGDRFFNTNFNEWTTKSIRDFLRGYVISWMHNSRSGKDRFLAMVTRSPRMKAQFIYILNRLGLSFRLVTSKNLFSVTFKHRRMLLDLEKKLDLRGLAVDGFDDIYTYYPNSYYVPIESIVSVEGRFLKFDTNAYSSSIFGLLVVLTPSY